MKKSILSLGLVALVLAATAGRSFGDYWKHDNGGYWGTDHQHHAWVHHHHHRGYYNENHIFISVP